MDSLYVKGITDEKFVARENRALATLLCHTWKVTQKKLQLDIRWIRRHTGDVEIPLLMSWQMWVRVRRHSIDGGSEFRRWVTGRKTFQKQRCLQRERTPCFGTQTGKGPCETEDPLHCTAQSTTKDETNTSDSSIQRSDTTGSTITSERSTTANQSSDLGHG